MNLKEYKRLYQMDIDSVCATRKGGGVNLRSDELKILRLFRFVSVNKDTMVSKVIWKLFLQPKTRKYGIDLSPHHQIGGGMIIGHIGRIIINGKAVIGEQFVVAPGVVIGADMGKRKGVPHIGNRVCIHSNAVVVGGINIGNDVVIAPGAFVNFDVPDHSVVVGNPGVIHHKENATENYIGKIKEVNYESN